MLILQPESAQSPGCNDLIIRGYSKVTVYV